MKILVTGGAGFIGSHLIDYLPRGQHHVICVDDLSMGRLENIQHHMSNPNFKFARLDILDKPQLNSARTSSDTSSTWPPIPT
jgi:nucleoside-diphosphate-sugar epimerase